MEGTKSINSTNSGDRSTPETNELKQLQSSVTKQHNKNKNRYQSLQSQGAYIGFQLHTPFPFIIEKLKAHQYQYTKIQLLLSSEKLFKQTEALSKIEMKHLNHQHQQNQVKNNLQNRMNNNYLFLRRSLHIQNTEQLSIQDRFDKLNKVIAVLKRGTQQTLKQTENTNVSSMLKDQQILSHPLYEKLKQNYEKCLMELQNIQQKFEEQLQKQIMKGKQLKIENDSLIKQIHGYKVKIRSLEMESTEYMSKINDLTEKMYQTTAVKKAVKEDKGLKYVGTDFELNIKSNKQFKLNYENQAMKRTLEQLLEFLQNYELQIKQHQQSTETGISQNNNCIEKQQETPQYKYRKSLSGTKRTNRIVSRASKLPDPTVTKMRFTRTSGLLGNAGGFGTDNIMKQGFLRTRTDSCRQ